MREAVKGEMDPIEIESYEVRCCDAWHGAKGGRRLVVFPKMLADGIRRLMMVVVVEKGKLKLDNLFALEDWERVLKERRLHRWSAETCEIGPGSSGALAQQNGADEEEDGAEYINDPDDFWGGYSDDEEPTQAEAEDQRMETPAPTANGVANNQRERAAPQTDPEAAIRDIIRGAFVLHRVSSGVLDDDASESFLQLVRSAISPQ